MLLTVEKEKSLALKQHNGEYEAEMSSTKHAKQELQWLVSNTPTAYNVINRCSPDMIVFTDASNIGWGGVIKGQAKAGDNWTPTEANNHINYLELLAILYSLQAFKKILKMYMLKLCVTTQQQFRAFTTWGLVIQTFVIH